MADVALQFVVDTLVPIIIENWKLIGGTKEDSAHLLGELNRSKAFLQDAAKYRESNSEQWKYFIKEVKKIREQNPEAFHAKSMLDYQPDIVAPGPQVWLDLLKTTLAIKIYNDPKISYEFYLGPQQYKPKEVFLSILEGFTKRTTEYQNMAVSDLTNIIREFILKEGKCLIVLDDVWATDVVDSVMKVFPENRKGHRIMFTTRDLHIGRYANPEPHSLKFLTDKESFQLLEKRVFGSNIRKCPEDLIAHGESIAKQCSGLPLALVVIAGALKGHTSERVWQMVKDNVGKHLINKDDPQSCLKYVEMSYGHLPEDMKACFLYCGAFPQGFEIPAWKLIRLWISEGLINSNLDGRPEDIAEIYLNELVNRNLVIVMQKSFQSYAQPLCNPFQLFSNFNYFSLHI
ncbi:putative late blight resistance protein homolog R1A-10 [Nicotiana tomentosiformis]|uniref:putative late blight resistance protein homolog R1A-10 n=1 Tax=Nicotiana tomentosiformis TaxID=4098 RepID=UPI00388C4A3F